MDGRLESVHGNLGGRHWPVPGCSGQLDESGTISGAWSPPWAFVVLQSVFETQPHGVGEGVGVDWASKVARDSCRLSAWSPYLFRLPARSASTG